MRNNNHVHEKKPRPKDGRSRWFINLGLSFLITLFVGCSHEESDWKNAQTQGTIDGYETFISKHPNSPFTQTALDEVWRLTTVENTIDSYETFISNHPKSPFSDSARIRITSIWVSVVPERPSCELRSDMTVDLRWEEMKWAQSYVVYWYPYRNFQKKKANSITTDGSYVNHKLRQGSYGAVLPMYYRVAAVLNDVESKLSDACLAQLLPDKGGRFCQICGEEAVGYCHLREIYVCSSHDTFTDDEGTHWRCP